VDTLYLLHIHTTLLLHVSVYLTPSSERNYLFLAQKHKLLHNCCV